MKLKSKFNPKKWLICSCGICFFLLTATLILTIVIDPFFHYHGPVEGFSYVICYQRYQNYGIVKHFDYDAIITGTSMTENFKTSEANELFDSEFVKVPMQGGTYKEINDLLITALESNGNIKKVIRGLDYGGYLNDATAMNSIYSYPTYLYDNNLINDINYIFNKNSIIVLIRDIINTILKKDSTSFDDYSNWGNEIKYGWNAIGYERTEKEESKSLTDFDKNQIRENVELNLVSIAEKYPNVDFYYFYTPYSILWWDNINQTGNTEKMIEAEKYATELILPCSNIHLYSYNNYEEIVCNIDNYRDTQHYGEKINSLILEMMSRGEGQINKDNVNEYFEDERNKFLNYNYDEMIDIMTNI